MPLKHGTSKKIINANTTELIDSGYKPAQAAAIAHAKARESAKKKRK